MLIFAGTWNLNAKVCLGRHNARLYFDSLQVKHWTLGCSLLVCPLHSHPCVLMDRPLGSPESVTKQAIHVKMLTHK